MLERTDQPLAEDLPIMREVRAALSKCMENGSVPKGERHPYPGYATYKPGDMPRLYSGCYGLGSRDLQPEGLIAAVENMLPDGRHEAVLLSLRGLPARTSRPQGRDPPAGPARTPIPRSADLALKGSENPNLLPKGAITVRMHSVGGWGAVTTGKNLAMTLFELLGFDIRANPKYGSEKKGQPTTYFLSAAPEPIRLNCEYHYVDVVMSPDPNVFTHSNPLFGLDKGGVFIIQSSLDSAEQVWATFPPQARQFIVEHGIRVFYVDGFKIAREEASDRGAAVPHAGQRLPGRLLRRLAADGARRTGRKRPVQRHRGAAARQVRRQGRTGGAGQRARGAPRLRRDRGDHRQDPRRRPARSPRKPAGLPVMLKQLPEGDGRISDVHRFWEQTGYFYATGRGSDNLADPYQALSLMPASTGVYRDMTQIRFEYPKFLPENCTACGNCFSTCPDSAIPGLVNSVADVFNTAILRVERGMPTQHLRRETRKVEKRLRELLEGAGEAAEVRTLLDQAVLETLAAAELDAEQKASLEKEMGLFLQALGDFQLAVTKPYWTNREKKQKGSGGLFSITVNPYTCKGCMECIEVCDDGALVAEPQTEQAIADMKAKWDIWLDLPTTDPDFIRIDDLDDKVGALETLLLDKANYNSLVSGDGACMGCGEKTVIHLFTATVTALMQPRVKRHLAEIDDLINRLETHVRLRLAESMDLSNTAAIGKALDAHRDTDLTLAELSAELDQDKKAQPVDPDWLKWVTGLLDRLRQLKARYTEYDQPRARDGHRQRHRLHLGMGLHLPLQPLPLPLDQPPVPGRALGGHGPVRGPHAQDGGGLQGHPPGQAGAGRQVPGGRAWVLLHLLQLEGLLRRTSGCCARRWSASAATGPCTTSASRTCRGH